MRPFANLPLESFLGCCRGDWRPRELKSVQRKLSAIGVEDVHSLLRFVHDGSLNGRLEGIGERRFTSDTLEAMRAAGVQLAGPHAPVDSSGSFPEVPEVLRPPSHGSSRQVLQSVGANVLDLENNRTYAKTRLSDLGISSRLRVPLFDFEPFEAEVQDAPSRPFTGNSVGSSFARLVGDRRSDADEEDAATLRQQICRGLSKMDSMAAEAKRRNGEVTRCLAEVQADIVRITDRMCAARQRRECRSYGSCDTSHPGISFGASQMDHRATGKVPPSIPKIGSAEQPRPRPSQSGPTPPSSLPRHRPSSESRPRAQPSLLRGGAGATRPPKEASSTRGMQSGFTFGGATNRPSRAPPLAAVADHPATRAREAVHKQLLAVRALPEADQKACVKKLMVQWHPDRNPDSIEVATSVFQFIQQEKDRILNV